MLPRLESEVFRPQFVHKHQGLAAYLGCLVASPGVLSYVTCVLLDFECIFFSIRRAFPPIFLTADQHAGLSRETVRCWWEIVNQ